MAEGLRISLAITESVQSISPWFVRQVIGHSKYFRNAVTREAARRAVRKRRDRQPFSPLPQS
jgi:hypothetical protein